MGSFQWHDGIGMGRLTTHVLDTARGVPGGGIAISLFALDGERRLLATAVTNDDGRTDRPLLDEADFASGDYYRNAGVELAEPPFLDDVVIRVAIADDDHYHVPLLVSPWSYSTYRGS